MLPCFLHYNTVISRKCQAIPQKNQALWVVFVLYGGNQQQEKSRQQEKNRIQQQQ